MPRLSIPAIPVRREGDASKTTSGVKRPVETEHTEFSMAGIEPSAQLNEGFSQPGATAPPWSEVAGVLAASEMFWLSTVRRDGRPHVTPAAGDLG